MCVHHHHHHIRCTPLIERFWEEKTTATHIHTGNSAILTGPPPVRSFQAQLDGKTHNLNPPIVKNKEKDVDGIANHQQPHQYIQHNHHSKNTSIQIIYMEKSNTDAIPT